MHTLNRLDSSTHNRVILPAIRDTRTGREAEHFQCNGYLYIRYSAWDCWQYSERDGEVEDLGRPISLLRFRILRWVARGLNQLEEGRLL